MQNPPGIDREPQFNKRLQENVKQSLSLSGPGGGTQLALRDHHGKVNTDRKSLVEPGTNIFIRVHKWSAFGLQSSKARLVKNGILVSFSVIFCKEHTRGRSLEAERSYHKDCWASCIRILDFLLLFLCQQTLSCFHCNQYRYADISLSYFTSFECINETGIANFKLYYQAIVIKNMILAWNRHRDQ